MCRTNFLPSNHRSLVSISCDVNGSTMSDAHEMQTDSFSFALAVCMASTTPHISHQYCRIVVRFLKVFRTLKSWVLHVLFRMHPDARMRTAFSAPVFSELCFFIFEIAICWTRFGLRTAECVRNVKCLMVQRTADDSVGIVQCRLTYPNTGIRVQDEN